MNNEHLHRFHTKVEHPKISSKPICGTASLPGITAVMWPMSELILIARRSFRTFSLEAKQFDIRVKHRAVEVWFFDIPFKEQNEWPSILLPEHRHSRAIGQMSRALDARLKVRAPVT